MAMRQQQAIQSAESGAAPEQLALRALPAIDHDAAAACLDQKARVITIGRRDAGRCSEEGEIEHRGQSSPPVAFRRLVCERGIQRAFGGASLLFVGIFLRLHPGRFVIFALFLSP
jgi:hypothetical protein